MYRPSSCHMYYINYNGQWKAYIIHGIFYTLFYIHTFLNCISTMMLNNLYYFVQLCYQNKYSYFNGTLHMLMLTNGQQVNIRTSQQTGISPG